MYNNSIPHTIFNSNDLIPLSRKFVNFLQLVGVDFDKMTCYTDNIHHEAGLRKFNSNTRFYRNYTVFKFVISTDYYNSFINELCYAPDPYDRAVRYLKKFQQTDKIDISYIQLITQWFDNKKCLEIHVCQP